MARTIRISLTGVLLAAVACGPSALPLRDDSSSAASVNAAEAPMPILPPIAEPGAAPGPTPAASPHEHGAGAAAPKSAVYTCGMHPEVRSSQPGKCPTCGMTLDLVEEKP